MQAYNGSLVLRNTGIDPLTNKKDLNAGISKNVTVRVAGANNTNGILADIYDIGGDQIANPLQSDDNGNYVFKVENGVYNIISNEGTTDEQIDKSVSIGVIDKNSAKFYGAIGDGISDDSDALQEWADIGGRLFLPRGNYRVTRQINFGPVSTVFGESAGAGTGGGEDVDEALAGASIIRPDVDNWSGDNHVFLFENKKTDLKAAPSVVIKDFKIECPRAKGVEAHLLTVVNAYDSLLIQNVNLIFSHKDYNALRLIEIDGTIFPRLSQTGVVMNVVTIGDDDNGDSANYVGDGVTTEFVYDFLIPDVATLDVFVDNILQDPVTYSATGIGSSAGGSVTFLTAPLLDLDIRINGVRSVVPVAYLRRQQEMQLIGLKSFGTAAKYYTQCQRVPTALEGCRGITGVGCSVASTSAIGLDIYTTETTTDGIVFTGTTFELCEGGSFLIDGFTRNIDLVNLTVAHVVIAAPRYQFPQLIAGFMKGCVFCKVEVHTKQITLSDGAGNNTITGDKPSNFTDLVGGLAGRSNVYFASALATGETYRLNQSMAIQADVASYDLWSKNRVNGYRLFSSASDTVNQGLEIRDAVTQEAFVTFKPNGQMQFNRPQQGPVLKTPDGLKDYEISVTNDGDLFVRNNLDPSDIHINNDRPITSSLITYTVGSQNTGGTVYKTPTTPNNVTIPTDATPITINATVNVIAEGSGEVTIQGESGVTINGVLNGSCIIEGWEAGKFVGVTLIKRGSDNWMVVGANSAVS